MNVPSSELRALIVDDEPLVRLGLRRLIAAEPDVRVVGECRNGAEALGAVAEHRPTVLFLDVEMPELDGIGVLRALGTERPAAIVFVTAFDRYAVEAFEHDAVDYLLKPFDDRRFRAAMERVRKRLVGYRPGDLERLAPHLGNRFLERIPVKLGATTTLVEVAAIDWIEAADNYVRLHVGATRHLLRDTLRNLEQRLDPSGFVRIHRSAMVNLTRVRGFTVESSGDGTVTLTSGAHLPLSRTYRSTFAARLAGPR